MRDSAKLFLLALLLMPAGAMAAQGAISASCRLAVDSKIVNWRVPVISKDVAIWAQQEQFNPVIAFGDFDGNGEADEAVLVRTSNSMIIAVCFSNRRKLTLRLIEQPYCSDYVVRSPARSEH